MDFSSLILMEHDENNNFVREIESYDISDGAQYIDKFYYKKGAVYIYFNVGKDVTDWEYSAIYDYFNKDKFTENGYEIKFIDDEYNPEWEVTYQYHDNYEENSKTFGEACSIISSEVSKVLEIIKDKYSEYNN